MRCISEAHHSLHRFESYDDIILQKRRIYNGTEEHKIRRNRRASWKRRG